MAIKSSGSLKFSEIAAEFEDTKPFSMSEFTRGGNRVPDASNNSNIVSVAARAARGVGGQMKWSHYYNAVRAIVRTISSNSENVDVASLFGTYWAQDIPKILNVDSGVTVGATSTGNAALTLPSAMVGPLVVNNDGSIQGAGGAAGANGGDAIQVSATTGVEIINDGTIYAGGGGGGVGGAGGTGGLGSVTTYTNTQRGAGNCAPPTGCTSSCTSKYGSTAYCGGSLFSPACCFAPQGCYGPGCPSTGGRCGTCWTTSSNTTYPPGGPGGGGGAGGVGQGYNQTNTNGDPGGPGNSGPHPSCGAGGAGGQGGAGGTWGTAGTTGITGTSGGQGQGGPGTSGSSGGAGGSGGNYINGYSNVTTFTNNGTALGGTAG